MKRVQRDHSERFPDLVCGTEPATQPPSDVERVEEVLRRAASGVDPLGDLEAERPLVLGADIREHEPQAVTTCLALRVVL